MARVHFRLCKEMLVQMFEEGDRHYRVFGHDFPKDTRIVGATFQPDSGTVLLSLESEGWAGHPDGETIFETCPMLYPIPSSGT